MPRLYLLNRTISKWVQHIFWRCRFSSGCLLIVVRFLGGFSIQIWRWILVDHHILLLMIVILHNETVLNWTLISWDTTIWYLLSWGLGSLWRWTRSLLLWLMMRLRLLVWCILSSLNVFLQINICYIVDWSKGLVLRLRHRSLTSCWLSLLLGRDILLINRSNILLLNYWWETSDFLVLLLTHNCWVLKIWLILNLNLHRWLI